jgi:hypothetical protein
MIEALDISQFKLLLQISFTIPNLPMYRSAGRAPVAINAKVIDDLTARLLPDIQRQLQEETDRTADFLKRSEKQTGADMPSARVFSLAQGTPILVSWFLVGVFG